MKDSERADKAGSATSIDEPKTGPVQDEGSRRRFWTGFEHVAVPVGVLAGVLIPVILLIIPNFFTAAR